MICSSASRGRGFGQFSSSEVLGLLVFEECAGQHHGFEFLCPRRGSCREGQGNCLIIKVMLNRDQYCDCCALALNIYAEGGGCILTADQL